MWFKYSEVILTCCQTVDPHYRAFGLLVLASMVHDLAVADLCNMEGMASRQLAYARAQSGFPRPQGTAL